MTRSFYAKQKGCKYVIQQEHLKIRNWSHAGELILNCLLTRVIGLKATCHEPFNGGIVKAALCVFWWNTCIKGDGSHLLSCYSPRHSCSGCNPLMEREWARTPNFNLAVLTTSILRNHSSKQITRALCVCKSIVVPVISDHSNSLLGLSPGNRGKNTFTTHTYNLKRHAFGVRRRCTMRGAKHRTCKKEMVPLNLFIWGDCWPIHHYARET